MKFSPRIFTIVFNILFAFFISSCTIYHSANMVTVTDSPSAVYRDLAIGQSTNYQYFGFIEDSKELLMLNAKSNMMRNRPLAKGEYYTNVAIDYRVKNYFFVVLQRKVTISADIAVLQDDVEKRFMTPLNLLNDGLDVQNHKIMIDGLGLGRVKVSSDGRYSSTEIYSMDAFPVVVVNSLTSQRVLQSDKKHNYVLVSENPQNTEGFYTQYKGRVYGVSVGERFDYGGDGFSGTVYAIGSNDGIIIVNGSSAYVVKRL